MGSTAGLLLGGAGGSVGHHRVFLVAGVAAIVLSTLIYVPYSIGARRRAQAAWAAAMASGSTRESAREAAQRAAISGSGSAWTATMEGAAAGDAGPASVAPEGAALQKHPERGLSGETS